MLNFTSEEFSDDISSPIIFKKRECRSNTEKHAAVNERFGKSGELEELIDPYEWDVESMVDAVTRIRPKPVPDFRAAARS